MRETGEGGGECTAMPGPFIDDTRANDVKGGREGDIGIVSVRRFGF